MVKTQIAPDAMFDSSSDFPNGKKKIILRLTVYALIFKITSVKPFWMHERVQFCSSMTMYAISNEEIHRHILCLQNIERIALAMAAST